MKQSTVSGGEIMSWENQETQRSLLEAVDNQGEFNP